jgi:hypothetical protein
LRSEAQSGVGGQLGEPRMMAIDELGPITRKR